MAVVDRSTSQRIADRGPQYAAQLGLDWLSVSGYPLAAADFPGCSPFFLLCFSVVVVLINEMMMF